jgi:stringent starvation protein B
MQRCVARCTASKCLLFAFFRHKTDVLRFYPQCIGDHFIRHRAFQIHARLQHAAQDVHVGILYVATIFAQVNGNGICACFFADQRGSHQIGIA